MRRRNPTSGDGLAALGSGRCLASLSNMARSTREEVLPAESRMANLGTNRHWTARNPTKGEGIVMRFNLPMAILMTLCVAACSNDAKSPETVDKDVAKAEQKASTEVAK